jgi:hypothetical protein
MGFFAFLLFLAMSVLSSSVYPIYRLRRCCVYNNIIDCFVTRKLWGMDVVVQQKVVQSAWRSRNSIRTWNDVVAQQNEVQCGGVSSTSGRCQNKDRGTFNIRTL